MSSAGVAHGAVVGSMHIHKGTLAACPSCHVLFWLLNVLWWWWWSLRDCCSRCMWSCSCCCWRYWWCHHNLLTSVCCCWAVCCCCCCCCWQWLCVGSRLTARCALLALGLVQEGASGTGPLWKPQAQRTRHSSYRARCGRIAFFRQLAVACAHWYCCWKRNSFCYLFLLFAVLVSCLFFSVSLALSFFCFGDIIAFGSCCCFFVLRFFFIALKSTPTRVHNLLLLSR